MYIYSQNINYSMHNSVMKVAGSSVSITVKDNGSTRPLI